MTDTILLEKQANGIAIITFNRPEALNALTLEMMNQFAHYIETLSHDDDLRVLILTGAGEHAFCSGGDLHQLSQYPSEDDARAFITTMGDALLKMERLPVPVIAAINGYSLGGGSEIAVACDMRIIDERTRMGFIQIRLALTPGWGAGQRLMRLVGYSRAMDVLLRGHSMRAHEIDDLRLASKVVEQGQALDQALYFARRIVQNPPDVVRGIKFLLQAGLRHDYEQALQIERDIFPPLWAADPHVEAVEKFLNREKKDDE